ncbi:hypothetical protein B0H11DRAFT_1908544 [Mycena galericulata]|nr:hypothetical protein B0H11DRAFT_1908544 [Mycena galericulata]
MLAQRTLSALPLIPLLLIAVYTPLAAGQANRTVDDFSPLITYSPAADVTHLDTTGFDLTQLYNGTIANMNASVDIVNMTLQFTGSAVWLFTAKPVTRGGYSTSYTIYLDGVDVDDSASFDQEDAAEYSDLAYSVEDLAVKPHTVILSASSDLYFDYAIFTSNNRTPEAPLPPVQAPSSSSTSPSGSSTNKSKSTSLSGSGGGAGASQSAGAKTTSHVGAIAGAAAGVLILLLGGGLACVLLRRRRQTRRGSTPEKYNKAERPMRFSSPYGTGGGGGGGGPVHDPFRSDEGGGAQPVAYASETALLRVPTTHSTAASHHTTTLAYVPPTPSPPAVVPSPHAEFDSAQFDYQPQPQPQPQSEFHAQYQYPSPAPPPPQQQHPAYPPSLPPSRAPSVSASGERYLRPPQSAHGYGPSPDEEYERMMAEQRAVEAEHTRPAEWGWPGAGAEKAVLAARLDNPPDPRAYGVYPNAGPAMGPGIGTPGGASPAPYTYPLPQTPTPTPNARLGAQQNYTPTNNNPPNNDPALSSIAAEMRALRAQVARLEGGRGGGSASGSGSGDAGHGYGEEEELPPAYWTESR